MDEELLAECLDELGVNRPAGVALRSKSPSGCSLPALNRTVSMQQRPRSVTRQPSFISRRRWVAEMPVFLLTSSQAAANHTVSGVRVLLKMVSAVAEVLRLQVQSHLASDKRNPTRLSQRGQTNPFDQRSQSWSNQARISA
ncbi:MAG: hypothetical protein M0008_07170 [Actinomycetota bacterium]|nr:hypothetical protein [Actinomycetota bacterium]